mgnify:CR=1 FL=1
MVPRIESIEHHVQREATYRAFDRRVSSEPRTGAFSKDTSARLTANKPQRPALRVPASQVGWSYAFWSQVSATLPVEGAFSRKASETLSVNAWEGS